MADEDKIHGALAARFATIAGEKAYENTAHDPVVGTLWMREKYLPYSAAAAGIGENACNRVRGIYRIDVFYPPGDGTYAAGMKAVEVIAAFKRGTVLVNGGVVVTCEHTYHLAGEEEPDWYKVPVIVEWRADMEN